MGWWGKYMPRHVDDRLRLLHGPYQPPALHVGDDSTCLFKGVEVVVTSWTDAPISWPRCLPVGSKGHPGLLVDAELVRAIRTESALTVRYWWGVSAGVVHRWRKAFGVARMDNPGSRRLILAASEKGADALRGMELPPEQVERRRQTAIEQDLGRNLITGYHGRRWTDEEIALLGAMPDAEVAARTGWPVDAVRHKRETLRIANPISPAWTEAEDAVLRRLPPKEAAKQTGRSLKAVYERRRSLSLPPMKAGRAPREKA